MNLHNHYWFFESALTPRFCDELIEYGLSKPDSLGLTGGINDKEKLSKKELKNLQKTRKSDVVFLDDHWIYKEIIPFVRAANNEAGWNFQFDYSESCQFTKYKLNQYYDWHCDSWDQPYNQPGSPVHGKVRKLSVTCQLSDGSEYEGGELEFDTKNYNPDKRVRKKSVIGCNQILPKGSIVVFPSFVWHRVKPVTAGTRYSLVIWNCGNPFM